MIKSITIVQMRNNQVINEHFTTIFIEILSDPILQILKKHFLIILLIWPSMDRLLSSRTPRFLTQIDKVRGKSTVLNAFATELDGLQVRPNRIH